VVIENLTKSLLRRLINELNLREDCVSINGPAYNRSNGITAVNIEC